MKDVGQRPLVVILGSVATIVACLLLDRVSASFVVEGVALIFPASAVAVISALLFGWWGVAATFIGLLAPQWGLATTLSRSAFFAGAASLQGAIPLMARLRPEGSTTRRLLRALLYCAVLNTLLSALVAIPAIARMSNPELGVQQTFFAFISWFLGDMTAILILGLPVLLLVRPELLLDRMDRDLLRRWMRRRSPLLAGAAIVAAVVLCMEMFAGSGVIDIHRLAVVLLIPVLISAATGAAGGGLLCNGAVGVVYVVEVLRLVSPESQPALFREVVSSYVNLLMFAAAAVVAGLYSGRAHALLRDIEEHKRLLQHDFERVVTALGAAIEAKDPTTQGHVQRVSRLAVALGTRLGLGGRRMEILRYAAILHDVGKIGVPEAILNKPGKLDKSERAVMEQHVRIGMEILENVDILGPAIPFIRYHQERWDGRTEGVEYPGYFGVKGEEIPLEARIIAVVDAYDAMTNDRPYRRGMSSGKALGLMRSEAGRQFDPRVVEALLDQLAEGVHEAPSADRWPILGGTDPRWIG